MESSHFSHQPYSRDVILRLVALMVVGAFAIAGISVWALYSASPDAGDRANLLEPGAVGLLVATLIGLTGIVLFRMVSAALQAAEREISLLATSESQMKTYFDNCPWGISITDTEGRYQFINNAFEKARNVSRDVIIGKTVHAHSSDAFANRVMAHERRVIESATTISEMRSLEPALKERISTKFPIFDEQGTITGIGTYVTDVSDLRRTEKALRASENRLTAIFENMPYGFSLKGLDGRYQIVNRPLADWFGRSPDEVVGKTIFDVGTIPARSADLTAIEKGVVANGDVVTTEVSRTTPEGGQEHMIVLKFPTRSDDGSVSGIGTFAIDITKQKQTEEALRKSESRLRDFADSASDWLWETDDRHRIVYLSDRFVMATGIPVDWILGKTRYEAKTGELVDPERWKSHREDLDAHRPFQDFVYHAVRANGETVWFSVSGIPVFDENGEFSGYRGTGSNITARVLAETELRDNQQLTQALLDHIPGMIGLRAPDGEYLLVNRCFERWTTVTKSNVNTDAGRKVWPGAYAEDFRARYQSIMSEDRPQAYETNIVFPDGVQRDIRAVRFPVHTEDGGLLGIGFVNIDISDIRRSQEKLREKEVQLRAIVDNAPGIITLTDMNNRYLLVNRPFTEAYGLDQDSVVGRDVQNVLTPAQWHEAQIHQQEVVEKRTAIAKERMDYFPSGDPNNRLSIKFPVLGGHGKITAIGTISIDDTDRRQAEEALKKSERLLRSIFDNSPSAITMKGLDGRYHLISRHIYDWYGVPENSMGSTTANEMFSGSIAAWIAKQDPEVIAQNRTLVEEMEHVFKDGTVHRVVISKFPVPGPDGKPVGIGSIITDVTAQRKSEEQLRQAQKMEVVGQLTGGVAHDFNNLLGVIIGNLDYLKSMVDSDQRSRRLVDNAMKAAHNGAELNRRLLAFSRKQPLAPKLLELNDHVAGMYDILQRSLGESIDIRTKYCEELWPCVADPAQVESALLNLAVNARDAMSDGGVLTIETRNIEIDDVSEPPTPNLQPGRYVMLSVSDTGTGMTPEVLEHAFEPFFTTKDVGKGSGLGLSMVFGFARQSGGDVAVHSALGSGTTFSLFLPRSKPAEYIADQFDEEYLPRSRGEAILVVEDNMGLMEVCLSFLRDLGYQTLAADDGQTASEILEREPHLDALLCDVVLPGGLSGQDFAESFIQRYPAGRVLYISGNAPETFNDLAPNDTSGVLLRKPFTKAQLAQRLRDVLDTAKQGRAFVA